MFKPYTYKKADITELNERSFANFVKPSIGSVAILKTVALKSIISAILISGGAVLMFTKVLLPVVNTYANTEDYTPIINPISSQSAMILSVSPDEEFSFKELGVRFRNDVNYVNENGILYIDDDGLEEETPISNEDIPDVFYLTIPALDIEDAEVETNSTNLDPENALGHYKGTCLPNEACNSFIFGHSTFTSSRNRYKQGDYSAIFSRLEELENGDEFYIRYNGEEFKYIVELKRIRRPEDVDPLEQPLPKSLGRHDSTVELFTCVPPGTTKYRLSVVGKLVR